MCVWRNTLRNWDWLISIGCDAPELVLAVTADRQLVALGHSNPDLNANGRDRRELFRAAGLARSWELDTLHRFQWRPHQYITANKKKSYRISLAWFPIFLQFFFLFVRLLYFALVILPLVHQYISPFSKNKLISPQGFSIYVLRFPPRRLWFSFMDIYVPGTAVIFSVQKQTNKQTKQANIDFKERVMSFLKPNKISWWLFFFQVCVTVLCAWRFPT